MEHCSCHNVDLSSIDRLCKTFFGYLRLEWQKLTINRLSEPSIALQRTMARNKPRQERSHARVTALLDAAESVIVDVGVSGLSMREVARRANLPIASVYHYFPAASAILRALADRNLGGLRNVLDARLKARLHTQDSMDTAGELIELVIDDIVAFLSATPSIPAIWNGLRANPELRALDIEDTTKNARFLEPYIQRLLPWLSPLTVKTMALVITESVGSTVLLAMECPPPLRDALVATLKTLIRAMFSGLVKSGL